MKKPLTLIIMDGFGCNPSNEGNAIAAAKTPNLDSYMNGFPMTKISASGMAVGLPEGQMGNSEVGHTNIGAGRVVYQELTRISKSISDGDFFENDEFLNAVKNCKDNNSNLHLMGLLSDGGVHSHITHLFALLKLAKDHGIKKVYVHCLLDGRDVSPVSGKEFVSQLYNKTKELGIGQIATVMGRYYGMDRDTQWNRVKLAYDAIVNAKGNKNNCAYDAVVKSYETIDGDGKNLTDEFVLPIVVGDYSGVNADDSFVFFNFRPDRAREITRALVDPAFNGFKREKGLLPLHFVCMTEYDATMPDVKVAFKPTELMLTMGEVLSKNGKTQLRIAETTKYAHVTFFFNGGEEVMFEGEDRVLIKTPEVATFDLLPEMSAYKVCDAVIEKIKENTYDVIILNFANCDMVGHTGIFDAAKRAVEVVDECVGKVVETTLKGGGAAIITADHGNADKMTDGDAPFTAHTTNPVPFIVVGYDCNLKDNGKLCDISPTMLDILGIEQPKEMTGTSLIVN